jgi:serine/threonine-protein kinase
MSLDLQQLRPGDAFAGRYKVLRLLRAGGMGAVYEVEDTATRRRRALKLMHPSLLTSSESRARFQREVFIGAELETEHIVEVIDAGIEPTSQVPYLTMELLKGEELGDRIERVGRLDPGEVCVVLAQVARALDKAHGKGIVHRDLKPENIFLTFREDGSVRAKGRRRARRRPPGRPSSWRRSRPRRTGTCRRRRTCGRSGW